VVKALRLEVTLRRIFVSLAAAGVLSAVIWSASMFMPADKPVDPPPAQAFVWSNRIPLTKAMLSQWLHARGANYAAWAKRHPGAAQRLALMAATNP